ncbi:MAG: PAS domain-containing protein [Bacteroidetes bacterium]|nr:PAS domain-containing protein [Bacteroidota bacterium]
MRHKRADHFDDEAREAPVFAFPQLTSEQLSYCDPQTRLVDEILASIGEVVWVHDARDLKLIYINNACEKVFGLKADEMIGTPGILFEKIHPDDRIKLNNAVEELIGKGRGRIEYRIYNAKDELRHISGEGYAIRGTNGEPLMFCGVSRDVTELRRIEEQLVGQVSEIENVFESITDNFIALDKEFNFTYANQVALNLYGVTRNELLGKNIWQKFPHGKERKFYTELKKALDEQVPVQFEEFSPSVEKWVSVNAYPTQKGLAVYFRDITDQRNVREILRNNEYNLRALINNTADFIWSVNRDFRIIQINQPFVDFVYSFTGKVLRPGDNIMSDDFGPAMRQKWEGHFKRALSGQTFVVIDEETIENTKHHREKRFKPIFSESGEVMGVSIFARDISEEARLNAKILNEEKKLRAIINNTKDIIWLIDDQMETISANQAYYDRVAVLTNNKRYEDITSDDFEAGRLARWQGYYQRALNDEAFTIIEEEVVDGWKRYEEIHFTPIHDKDNKVVSVNCMSRDITAETEHLIKIKQQNEKLNEIAGLQSHQVRGPVATILGLAQLINTSDPNDPTNLTVLEGIREVATDLDNIIKDVVAKTNAAKM